MNAPVNSACPKTHCFRWPVILPETRTGRTHRRNLAESTIKGSCAAGVAELLSSDITFEIISIGIVADLASTYTAALRLCGDWVMQFSAIPSSRPCRQGVVIRENVTKRSPRAPLWSYSFYSPFAPPTFFLLSLTYLSFTPMDMYVYRGRYKARTQSRTLFCHIQGY